MERGHGSDGKKFLIARMDGRWNRLPMKVVDSVSIGSHLLEDVQWGRRISSTGKGLD